MYDAIIIGAGVVGCAVAQQLARYDGKLLVIQRGTMSDRDRTLKEGPLQLKDGELKIGK